VGLCVRASEVWAVAIFRNRHDTNLCVCDCACARCVCTAFVRAGVCMYSKQLFNKWSSTKKKGSREKSVDFKEFCEMLKVLQLKVGKHKAQEIFRQVIMCMCNLRSGASPAVRLMGDCKNDRLTGAPATRHRTAISRK
jgi:hypothetical protein